MEEKKNPSRLSESLLWLFFGRRFLFFFIFLLFFIYFYYNLFLKNLLNKPVLLNSVGEFCVLEHCKLVKIFAKIVGSTQEIRFKTFLILLCVSLLKIKNTIRECSINQNSMNQSFSMTIIYNDVLKELKRSGPLGILVFQNLTVYFPGTFSKHS